LKVRNTTPIELHSKEGARGGTLGSPASGKADLFEG
jgi:hypothetical protein